MRSFVIWYSKRKEKESVVETSLVGQLKTLKDKSKKDASVDLHVNLWEIDPKRKKCDFDFGIKIYDITLIKELKLYIPFKVENKDIKDLGKCLNKDSKLINALFNENCRTSNIYPKRFLISSGDSHFIIYNLDESQIKLNTNEFIEGESHGGTILSIDLKHILSAEEIEKNSGIDEYKQYYFRIRINFDFKKIYFIKNRESEKTIFSNAFKNHEIIDFRINDIEACSDKLREIYLREEHFKINKIRYLLLRNPNDELIYHSEVTSRLLESEIWKNYYPGLKKDVIAYFIKNKDNTNETKKFSVLTRFKFSQTSWGRVIAYILIILILGSLSPYITSLYDHKIIPFIKEILHNFFLL